MSESTKDLLFSFIPLGGWVASLHAEPFWQHVGMIDLLVAFIILATAIAGRIEENRSKQIKNSEY